jgi:ATP-dependent helicase/nuclease subunit A
MSEPADLPLLPGADRNAVVAASAGTGKTHLIANVYLCHVLGLTQSRRVVPTERIVATTFSRAAAREIRERLELRLAVIAGEASEREGTGLDAELSARAELLGVEMPTLRARAKTALDDLPKTLIDTLHGLAARVLRTHALELGLTPGFEILDEQSAFEDATDVVEDVLSRALGAGDAQREAVSALLDAGFGLDFALPAIVNLLSLLDEEGLDADALDLPDHARDAEVLRATLTETARLVAERPGHPLREAALACVEALRDLADGSPLRAALTELFKDRAPKLAKYEHGAALTAAFDALLAGTSKAERFRRSALFLAGARRLDEQSRLMRGLFAEIQREIQARRRARGALGFGDLLRLARDALRDHPELAATAAESIELLLVDEFQDTSRVQRDLVLLLRERPSSARRRLAGALPAPADLEPRGLMVVGDRKQSIYAFRGADVAVYARLAAELAGAPAVQALDLHGVEANPSPVADFASRAANFRSGAAILDFVNRVFVADFNPAPSHAFEIRYMPSEALVPPAATKRGPGRVTLLSDDGSTLEASAPLTKGARGALRTALAVAGFCAQARSEQRSYRDIAVLARRRSTLPLLELALDRAGVPFVVAGRALYATSEVRDLAALLRLVLDPYDRHSLATVLRSPLGGLSDRALAELSRPGRGLTASANWREMTLTDEGDRLRLGELSSRLAELAEVGPRLSPRDVLAFAVDRFELEAVLSALPRGAARFGNVGRLLEIAARHGGGLAAFVRWLDRQIALEVDESEAATFSEDDDAVRLLTIHASKGLSFKVTVVADLGATEMPPRLAFALQRTDDRSPTLVIRHRGADGPVPTPSLGRYQEEGRLRAQAERERLFYVALTRAEEELVLALPPTDPAPKGLAATLLRLRESGAFADSTNLRQLESTALFDVRAEAEPLIEHEQPIPARPSHANWQTAAIGVTALSDFALCPRRFQLLHVFGVEELDNALSDGPARNAEAPREAEARGEGDARALGSAAHRVLEHFPLERWGEALDEEECLAALVAEGLLPDDPETRATARGVSRFLGGNYARDVRDSAAQVHRELELAIVTSHGEAPARRQLELFAPRAEPLPPRHSLLRATLDLVVERADGSIDIIDYKRSRSGAAERYVLQLYAYRRAVVQHFGARPLRSGLVPLLGESAEPEWTTPRAVDLAKLVEAVAERRYTGEFPGVPRPRCELGRCGFLAACHPRGGKLGNGSARRSPRVAKSD